MALQDALVLLWSALHGELWLLQNLHWRAKGTGYYADHQLYERLYEARRPEIDRVAEVIVAVAGAQALNAGHGLEAARDFVIRAEQTPGSDAHKALNAAHVVSLLLRDATAQSRGTPFALGVDNVLAGIADAHLEAVYLLQQRLAGTLGPLKVPAVPRAPVFRSSAGRGFAGVFEGQSASRETSSVAPGAALGLLGDALAGLDAWAGPEAGEARETSGALGKGLALGAGIAAALAAWKRMNGR